MAIKLEYGVKKNWMGDPCFPTNYAWDGVKCSNTSDNTTRITSLDLSNSNLRGAISTKFTLLTALKNLDLSYNNLSGSMPDSLPNLPSLRVLNLSSNHLSGSSLCKNYTGSLIFRYDSDKNMCNKTINPSRKRAVVLVTSVVVSVLVVAVLFLAYFIWRAKRKPNVSIDYHAKNQQLENAPRSRKSQGDHLQDIENRRFTYNELEKFTDNFKRFIGQGGFGLVYYGHLEDGTEVAVKMRSESSSHGLDEFLAEVQSLTKVHHRHLVSLVGYCWEQDHLALVYEYMSQGNLYDHLRGKNADAETLNWGTRVQIVLEAAQGLDYLHKGCSPPIIHRDVKSSNILLGQNLQAKIADLGLSRTYLNDAQTHISATAAGTAGYMDPEYYLTGRLTESSDVYSFGVVLLEAATGEPPMVPGHGHIVQRVKQRITTGDICLVADPRLRGAYDVSSMWKVVDIAMMCTADAGAGRPTMADVVAQLKDSLALEDARENECSVPAEISDWEVLSVASACGGGDVLHDHFALGPPAVAPSDGGFSGEGPWSEPSVVSDGEEQTAAIILLNGFDSILQERFDLLAGVPSEQLQVVGVDEADSRCDATRGPEGRQDEAVGVETEQIELSENSGLQSEYAGADARIESSCLEDVVAADGVQDEQEEEEQRNDASSASGCEEPDGDANDVSLPLVPNPGTGGEGEKQVVWCRLPFRLLHYCAWKVKPVWSFSIAAALLGLAVLGRRMYMMRRSGRGLPQIKIVFDDKRTSQFADRATRLNEAFLIARRVPMLRTSSGAVLPWSMVQDR